MASQICATLLTSLMETLSRAFFRSDPTLKVSLVSFGIFLGF
jgi:hypothetical protein